MPQFPSNLSALPMASRVKLQLLSLACKAWCDLGLACLSSLFPQSAPSSCPVPRHYSTTGWLSPASVALAIHIIFSAREGLLIFPDSFLVTLFWACFHDLSFHPSWNKFLLHSLPCGFSNGKHFTALIRSVLFSPTPL